MTCSTCLVIQGVSMEICKEFHQNYRFSDLLGFQLTIQLPKATTLGDLGASAGVSDVGPIDFGWSGHPGSL